MLVVKTILYSKKHAIISICFESVSFKHTPIRVVNFWCNMQKNAGTKPSRTERKSTKNELGSETSQNPYRNVCVCDVIPFHLLQFHFCSVPSEHCPNYLFGYNEICQIVKPTTGYRNANERTKKQIFEITQKCPK